MKKKEKKEVKQQLKQIENDEYQNLKDNLDKLKGYYGESNIFYLSFRNAILESYYKSRINKQEQWRFLAVVMDIVSTSVLKCASVLCTLSSGVLLFDILTKVMTDENLLQQHWSNKFVLIAVVMLFVAFLVMFLITTYRSRRKYQETWVRHKVSYVKMNICMIDFLHCSDKTPMAALEFEKKVFQLLEENLTQFQTNMLA